MPHAASAEVRPLHSPPSHRRIQTTPASCPAPYNGSYAYEHRTKAAYGAYLPPALSRARGNTSVVSFVSPALISSVLSPQRNKQYERVTDGEAKDEHKRQSGAAAPAAAALPSAPAEGEGAEVRWSGGR